MSKVKNDLNLRIRTKRETRDATMGIVTQRVCPRNKPRVARIKTRVAYLLARAERYADLGQTATSDRFYDRAMLLQGAL